MSCPPQAWHCRCWGPYVLIRKSHGATLACLQTVQVTKNAMCHRNTHATSALTSAHAIVGFANENSISP